VPNITIFDYETVFVNINSNKSKNKEADIIVQNSDYAFHMKDLFNHYWEKSLTIEEFRKQLK
jgi:hypothetical protein